MKKIVCVICILFSGFSYANWFSSTPPNCDKVDDVLKRMLDPIWKDRGYTETLEKVSSVREQYLDSKNNTRYCSAVLETQEYKFATSYSISPMSNDFLVKIENMSLIIDESLVAKNTTNLSNQLAEEKIKAFEMAKKYGEMSEACLSLDVAKKFYLDAANEEGYKKTMELLKQNCH
ncbi:hypothetical protein [Lonepinella sp. BR2271]|uniref:hypothetical protein n=1 Tax=Lonepinella sp. BR2271 TaxID=3434550 RepID=UPI003F6DDAA4